ncbi:MAG: hypothetical protein GY927_02785 [bacterium]|nr:hypothetical protein [bacterium]
MTVISARKFLSLGLAILLPLALGACGNSGSGVALKNSAHLTSPPLQADKPTASAAAKKSSDDAEKQPEFAAKTPDAKVKQAVRLKAGEAAKPIVNAKAGKPPIPVRRPYRKMRKKSVARMIKEKKSSADSAKKVIAKAVVKPKIQARAVHVATPVIAAKAPKAKMVPATAVRAQVAPEESTELIFGGFINGSGVNATHELTADEIRAAKMAQAESVVKKPSFGQSEFRFSSQK